MRLANCCLLFTAVLLTLSFQTARAEDKMVHAAAATSKFVNLPTLPKCSTASVQSGDPSKGASVILAKVATGCTIPWHWHSSDEQIMMVSGSGKVAMKDGAPASARAGDYLALPAKQVHQFSCAAACTLFVLPSGVFDLHYVDKDGKEISPEEALKAKSKAPMKSEMKKEMKK